MHVPEPRVVCQEADDHKVVLVDGDHVALGGVHIVVLFGIDCFLGRIILSREVAHHIKRVSVNMEGVVPTWGVVILHTFQKKKVSDRVLWETQPATAGGKRE